MLRCMKPGMDDQAVAQRVLDHIANGTTDLGRQVWREPVENYRSPARLQAEQGVLRRCPTPFCPSAALPEPGSFVAREAAGVPLVVVRGTDGEFALSVTPAAIAACRSRA